MKRLIFVAALFAVFVAARPASCATLIDRVVAVVGDDVITLSELQGEMATAAGELSQRLRGEDLAREMDRLKRGTLDGLIDRRLQVREARLQGIEVSDEEVDAAIDDIMRNNKMDMPAFVDALAGEGYTMEDYKKNLSDQLTIMRLVAREVKSKVSIKEEDVEAYYKANPAKFSNPESIRVANIVFPAKGGDMDGALKNAEAARAEIAAGTPFEEMAAKCTGDPEGAKKCVLGTFGRGELAPELEAEAFALGEGEVSRPLKTATGYQLVKVMSKTAGGLKPLAEVHDAIVDDISGKKGEELFAGWLQGLRKKTYVEIRD